jgi:hypothetical protein
MLKFIVNLITSIIIILAFLCNSIFSKINNKSEDNLYEITMNQSIPSSISDFEFEGLESFPIANTKIYFNYKSNYDYLKNLTEFNNFSEENEFNEKFEYIGCSSYPSDYFNYWLNNSKLRNSVDLLNSNCMHGINFPYEHILVINKESFEIQHFVTGIRG